MKPLLLIDIQARCRRQLQSLHPSIRRLQNPHAYPAGLERGLWEKKEALIATLRATQKNAASNA